MSYKYAGRFLQPFVSSSTGRPLVSTAFSVYSDAALSTLATLYTDRTKAVAAANPSVTDAYGNGGIYTDPGLYWIVCNGVTQVVNVDLDATEAFYGGRRDHELGAAAPVIAETVPRWACDTDGAVLTTQIVQLQLVELPPNQACTSLTYVSGATAANVPTNWWFVLADKNRVVKAVTADQLATAWPANTAMTVAFGTPFTTPAGGPDVYYVGIMVKATAVPSLRAPSTLAVDGALASLWTPTLQGASSVGQTTPPALASTLTAVTAGRNRPYAAVK